MKKRFLVVAAVSISSTSWCQQDSTFKALEEVSVVATRFPKKLGETGKVVNIISRADLDRAGGKDLSQVLNEQAGIIINGATSNPGKDKSVYLRGARTNYTVILVNGVPVSDPTGVGGAFDLRMIPVEQIDRIEILKGAQSTLYGSDAIAGVINIIAKRGGNKPASLYGGFSAGNYKTIKAHAGLAGSVEKVSYNIVFTHNETDGVPEAKDTNAIKTFPKNGLNQNSVSMDFDGQVVKGLHLKPFLRYSNYKGTFSDGAFMPATNEFKSRLLTAGTQAEYSFLHGSVTGLYSYDEIARSYNTSFGLSGYEGNKKTAEVFGHYDLGKYIQALAGVRYDRYSYKNPSPGVNDTSAHITSPYLSIFLKNLGGFNLEMGGRYNDHSAYGSNFTYSINPSFLLKNKIKFFANYGTAFKAPALAELFGQYGANPNLKPEKSRTFEGGVQVNLLNEKLIVRGVYFDRHIRDVIVYDNNFNYTNYDKQDDHGFEIEPTWLITKNLTLKVFYSFVDGKVTQNNAGKDTSYYNLIRRPKHSVGVNLGYQITPALYVSTNVHSFGKRDDLFFNSMTFLTEPKELDSYVLWDAYAEYSIVKKKLKIFAQVNNILNEKYDEVYGYTTLRTNFTGGFHFNL